MKSLRLISYNLHKGLDPIGRSIGMGPIKAALKTLSPDFLLVQELAEKNHEKIREVQLEDLADANWKHHAYGKNAVYPKGNHGNAILSSLPISEFYNLDLSRHRWERRGLLHAKIEGPRTLHLLTTHLDLLEFTRRQQVESIFVYLDRIPTRDSVILAGDFNDWTASLQKAFQSKGFLEFTAPSFPSWFPVLSLDRIYTRNIEVKKFHPFKGRPWNSLSDHLPVALDFHWNHPTRS